MSSAYNTRGSQPKYNIYVPGWTAAAYPYGLPQVSMGLNPVPFEVGTGLVVFPEALPNVRAETRRRQMQGLSGGRKHRRSASRRRSSRKSRRSGRR